MVFYADIFYLGVVCIQKWVVLRKSFLVTILACKDKLYNHWDVSVSKLQGIWRQTHQFSFRGASSPFSLLNSAELRLGHGWEHKYFARKGLCYFEPCVTVIKDSLQLYFSYFSVVHQDHSFFPPLFSCTASFSTDSIRSFFIYHASCSSAWFNLAALIH